MAKISQKQAEKDAAALKKLRAEKRAAAKTSKKRSTGRRRRSTTRSNPANDVMNVLGAVAGGIGASYLANMAPVKDPRIKAALPLAVTAAPFLIKGLSKNKMAKPLAIGAGVAAGLSLAKQFAPQVQLLAGEGENYMGIPYEYDMPMAGGSSVELAGGSSVELAGAGFEMSGGNEMGAGYDSFVMPQ